MKFTDIFNDLFLEANPEKRILFLQDKYGAKLEQLFTKYRFDLTLFKNIYRKTPIEYIVNTIDPTDGTYQEELYKFRPNSTPQVNTESSAFDQFISKFT